MSKVVIRMFASDVKDLLDALDGNYTVSYSLEDTGFLLLLEGKPVPYNGKTPPPLPVKEPYKLVRGAKAPGSNGKKDDKTFFLTSVPSRFPEYDGDQVARFTIHTARQ